MFFAKSSSPHSPPVDKHHHPNNLINNTTTIPTNGPTAPGPTDDPEKNRPPAKPTTKPTPKKQTNNNRNKTPTEKVLAAYQPGAVVMCCGADSLSGDRLGCFNLSLQGHSQCIEYVARTGVPTLVLGGGGYTLRNVARCWCYETGRLMGLDLRDELPAKALAEFHYYMDNSRLRIAVSNMRNANTRAELERTRDAVLEQLSRLPACPSAGIRENPPPLGSIGVAAEEAEEDPDARDGGQAARDARVEREGDAGELAPTQYDAGGRDADEAALRMAQERSGHTRGESVPAAAAGAAGLQEAERGPQEGAAAGAGAAAEAAAAAAPAAPAANGDAGASAAVAAAAAAAAAPPDEAAPPAPAAAMEVDAAAKPEPVAAEAAAPAAAAEVAAPASAAEPPAAAAAPAPGGDAPAA